MIFFACPSCGRRHELLENAEGRLLWCSCGLLLHIGEEVGQVIRPGEPKLVEHPQTLGQCHLCYRLFPTLVMMSLPEGWTCDECGLKIIHGEEE